MMRRMTARVRLAALALLTQVSACDCGDKPTWKDWQR